MTTYINIIDIQTGITLLEQKYNIPVHINTITLNDDETKIVNWNEKKIFITDIMSNKTEFSFECKNILKGVLLTQDKKRVISWDKKQVYIHDLSSKNLIKSIKYNLLKNVRLTKKGNILISLFGGLELRSQKNGNLLYKVDKIDGGNFIQNEKFLISWNNKIIAFSAVNPYFEYLRIEHPKVIRNITMNKDESLCASWDDDTIIVWNINTLRQDLILKHHKVGKIIFDKKSTKLLSANNKEINLWDIKTGEKLLSLDYNEKLLDVHFNENENCIISLSYDDSSIYYDSYQIHLNKYFLYRDRKLKKSFIH